MDPDRAGSVSFYRIRIGAVSIPSTFPYSNTLFFPENFNMPSKILKIMTPLPLKSSVADPDPNPDPPDVFGPPGSVSTKQRYGSGSFYNHAKIERKTLIPTIL